MLILPCSASQIHISAFIWEDKAETRHYVTHPGELERSVFRISWQLKPSPGGSAAAVSLAVACFLCLLWDASYPRGGICFPCSQRTVTPASASSVTTMVKINERCPHTPQKGPACPLGLWIIQKYPTRAPCGNGARPKGSDFIQPVSQLCFFNLFTPGDGTPDAVARICSSGNHSVRHKVMSSIFFFFPRSNYFTNRCGRRKTLSRAQMKAWLAICALSHPRSRRCTTYLQNDIAVPHATRVRVSRARGAGVTPLVQIPTHPANPLHWISVHEMWYL